MIRQETRTTGVVVYTIGYAYDLDGNVTQITCPSGRTVSYGRGVTGLVTLSYPYNSNLLSTIANRATTLRSFAYDGAGNVITDTQGSTAYNYRYNNRGRLDQLTIGPTVTGNYSYDGLRMSVHATQNMMSSTMCSFGS